LNIIAHDRFQEIIDEANKPDSAIRLQQVILDPTRDLQKMVTVISQSNIVEQLEATLSQMTGIHTSASLSQPIFTNEAERKIAQATYEVIKQYEILPNSACLLSDDIQQKIVEEVVEVVTPAQIALTGVSAEPDIAYIVHKSTALVVQQTIDIPRILVVPTGEVSAGVHA